MWSLQFPGETMQSSDRLSCFEAKFRFGRTCIGVCVSSARTNVSKFRRVYIHTHTNKQHRERVPSVRSRSHSRNASESRTDASGTSTRRMASMNRTTAARPWQHFRYVWRSFGCDETPSVSVKKKTRACACERDFRVTRLDFRLANANWLRKHISIIELNWKLRLLICFCRRSFSLSYSHE